MAGINTFKEQLDKLYKLQRIDSMIYDLNARLESFPKKIKEIDDSLESKKTGIEAAEDNLKQLQVKKNDKENNMQSKEEKIKKHESDLYQIKNNNEYKALQHEIENLKADVSIVEEDLIALFDQIEAAKAKISEEKKKFEGKKQEDENIKQGIIDEEKSVKVRLDEIKQQRGKITADIPAGTLSVYDRILKNKGKTALALVEGEFCGQCNMQLRPQIINEAKMKNGIVTCENCSRILYAKE